MTNSVLEDRCDAIIGRLASGAAASGHFDVVQGFEPKSAPGAGLVYAIFVDRLDPIPQRSGLASTSMRVAFVGRIYKPFLSAPQDLIDPAISRAAAALVRYYSADFELGGEVTAVDLLGAYGAPLAGRGGYQTIDKTTYRIMDITLPLILDDVFPQEA